MKPNGQLTTLQHTTSEGFRSYTYHWEGGPAIRRGERVLLDLGNKKSIKAGDRVAIGPYRFVIVEFDIDYLLFAAVRIDSWEGPLWLLAYHMGQLWAGFSVRMILTLAIWGLAEGRMIAPNGCWTVTWDQVYVVRGATRLARRLRSFVKGRPLDNMP
jgi:hypothetical protein